MTTSQSAAKNWPALYGDFRQGFLSESEARAQLWQAGYSQNEAFDVIDAWTQELFWEDVGHEQREASRL